MKPSLRGRELTQQLPGAEIRFLSTQLKPGNQQRLKGCDWLKSKIVSRLVHGSEDLGMDPLLSETQRRLAVQILKERLTWAPSVASLSSRVLGGNIRERLDIENAASCCHLLHLLPSNQENFRKLMEIVMPNLTKSANSSVFLVGPRGCGKSLVAHKVVQSLLDDGTGVSARKVLPIYVNGRFAPDDQQAFSAITSMLQQEIDRRRVGEAVQTQAVTGNDFRSLLEILSENEKDKSVILVLDEVDVFASRSRQALLYSVFDSLQSSDLSLSVIGISARHDVEQLLEKRVKSRHSGRKIVFVPPAKEELVELAKRVLLLPERLPSNSTPMSWSTYSAAFNKSVSTLFQSPASLPPVLSAHLSADLTPAGLSKLLFRAISAMDMRQGSNIEATDFEAAAVSSLASSRLNTLLGLTVLELFLLTAMRRLERRQQNCINFTKVFEEYRTCVTQGGGSSDLYSRESSRNAFQRLQEQGLVVPVPGSTGNGRRGLTTDFAAVQSAVFPLELELALEKHKQCPSKLKSLLNLDLNPGLSSRSLW